MLVVGLTGGIGSGKSAAADFFIQLGIPVLDTDQVARTLTQAPSPALTHIAQTFGADFLLADGSLNRAAMRELVFTQPEERQRLESILHPLILQAGKDWLAQQISPYCILAVPLLFEAANFQALIDCSVVVDCPEELQISRVIERNGLSEKEIRNIMANQLTRTERNQRADYLISNSQTLHDLQNAVEKLHQKLLLITQSAL